MSLQQWNVSGACYKWSTSSVLKKKKNDSRASSLSVALIVFSQCNGRDMCFHCCFLKFQISPFYCSPFRLFAREDGNHVVQIVGLREVQVDSVDHLLEVMFGIHSLSSAAWFADFRGVSLIEIIYYVAQVYLLFKALKLATPAEHQGALLKVLFFIKLFLVLATYKQLIHSCHFCSHSLGKDSRS